MDVHVIHWSVNKEAPFIFKFPEPVLFYEKNTLPGSCLKEKIYSLEPDFIYCSGWMDKDYLKAVKGYKKKIPVVIGLDTWWEAKPAQFLACIASPFFITSLFSHCWVPGKKQKQYALKLGFNDENIMLNYYCADTDNFFQIGEDSLCRKKKKYPHRFLYVGRYYDFKGITDLWEAFIGMKKDTDNDWELWCLGTGSIPPMEHPFIRHFGFIQPSDMASFINDTGVAVMPSRFEPWGVALHEFTAAGLPVICSSRVGAAEIFMDESRNGYIYPAGNIPKLKEALTKCTLSSDDELIKMGIASRELAKKITPELWSQTLMNVLGKNNNK